MMAVVIVITAYLASLLTLFSGFGLGTLLMPIIAIFFPVAIAIAMTAFVHLLNNIFKLLTLWKSINWYVSLYFGVPALLAAIPGAWILTNLSTQAMIAQYGVFNLATEITPIKLVIGVLLIVFSGIEFFSISNKLNISKDLLPFGGILSGFFGGLSGHQGAFRSAFLLHADLNPQQFIATNAAIATLVDITRLIIYGINIQLLFNEVDTILVIVASCAAFAGVLTGTLGIHKVTIHRIQTLVAYLLLGIGILLSLGIL